MAAARMLDGRALQPEWPGTPGTSPTLLHADGLCFGYPGTPLFENLSLHIPAGLTLVYGGDGRGKTTLLRLLAGELAPQAGSLRAGNIGVAHDPEGYRRQVFRPDMATGAFAQQTPVEVLEAVRARWPSFDAAELSRLLDGLALQPHLAKRMSMLSTGTMRKVWLAAAFAARAPVTLVDDPFGALDRPSVRFALECLHAAAADRARAFVFSAWEVPEDLPLAAVIDLGE